jgi:Na+/H+ antiporter NhaD/arsenite permease-like protein|tara:strand:- start:939 stop:1439 length:501 start_codon:yes stop_codon:yes gene_type:complete
MSASENRKETGAGKDRRGEARFDFFTKVEGVEFDTLLFFFGVLTAVGALQYIGYLAIVSENMYGTLGPTISNVLVGVLSAIVDNIPVMFAVLKMEPIMGLDQWLLITLTTGTGGSLLSVGSAAGVAVMGVDRKNYTFISHLKWVPAIAAGYVASIGAWWLVTMGLR